MGVELSVTIKDDGVRELMARIQKKLRDLKPVMEIIGEIGHASIQRNFEVGGRPKWARLKPSTIAQRIRQKKWPGQVLVRTGLLKNIHYRAGQDQVKFSANAPQAALMQFGAKKGQFGTVTARIGEHVRRLKSGATTRVKAHTRQMAVPWGDIPARPFMVLQEEDWEEMRESLGEFILKLDN